MFIEYLLNVRMSAVDYNQNKEEITSPPQTYLRDLQAWETII